MDNNLRTVKKEDLKTFIYDTFASYGVRLADVTVSVNSLYIRINFERNNLNSNDIDKVNSALKELFKANVFSSDPGELADYRNGYFLPLIHPFNIVG